MIEPVTKARPFGLTARHEAVLELVSRRLTLKEIAARLHVSESSVNQTIKRLKLRFGVNSLTELAEIHRAGKDLTLTETICRKPACRISHLSGELDATEGSALEADADLVSFQDAIDHLAIAPWMHNQEPVVVPGMLDGPDAIWFRGLYIVLLTLGLLAALTVCLGAAQGITNAMQARRAHHSVSTTALTIQGQKETGYVDSHFCGSSTHPHATA